MDKILHQLIGSLSHYLQGFYTSQVVQDFFHQQYQRRKKPINVPTQSLTWGCLPAIFTGVTPRHVLYSDRAHGRAICTKSMLLEVLLQAMRFVNKTLKN